MKNSPNNQTRLNLIAKYPLSEYFDGYFQFAARLNALIPYSELAPSDNHWMKLGSVSSQKLKRSLKEWCDKKGYTLNPEELHNSSGRIIRRLKRADGTTVAAEFFFIKTI
jgi:hypothetical protein